MKKNILMSIVAIILFSVNGTAQSDAFAEFDAALKDCLAENSTADNQDKCLDKALDACVDKKPSTQGEAQCALHGYKMWDRELNKIYSELRAKLTSKERKVLKRAQKKWLKYRNAEFKLIDQMYSYEKGTMNIPFNAHARLKLVRKRVLELKRYSSGYLAPN